jgi:hypothetical protein
MASLPRSLSTPHVAQQQPFLVASSSQPSSAARAAPRIRRHHTSLALTDLVARRTGHQTPRSEDDPFSLGGFFPSPLAVRTPEHSDAEWTWLHAQQQDAFEAEERLEAEEGEHDGSGCHVMFDRAQDVKTAETIKQEDKLGILSLRCTFYFSHTYPCDGLSPLPPMRQLPLLPPTLRN